MSRFLLVNLEDFGLSQDITKAIQPFNPFCICCLDRQGPMINLELCDHSTYLDSFGKLELKHYNQLVCLHCHSFMKKIKCFESQVLESFHILLSGTYTNDTVHSKRINNLTIQQHMEILHLPPEPETPIENIAECNTTNPQIEPTFMDIQLPLATNLEENINESSRLSLELNKNIKTALDILERNNQNFVSLGSQLQFLNGEHLSFLESSLLSKEILTDIPMVPKNSMDLDNSLIDNSKLEIDIDCPEKIFYDSLDLSPGLLGTNGSSSQMIETDLELVRNQEPEPKNVVKPKIKRPVSKGKAPRQIKPVRLSPEELSTERVKTAQSEAYLKFKYRCETCLLGFNYVENLEDHNKRKHGPKQEGNVVCIICSQNIPTAGAVTEHNYRHYTRYECLQCGKRYQTQDEATQHAIETHNANNKRTKLKRVQRIRKMKLKPKPMGI